MGDIQLVKNDAGQFGIYYPDRDVIEAAVGSHIEEVPGDYLGGYWQAVEQEVLRYIESRGRPMASQKAWAKATFGLSSDPSGSHYEAMRAVIESGFIRKNNDGSITPAIRERVEEELDGYDVDRTTIGDTHERVLARLAA